MCVRIGKEYVRWYSCLPYRRLSSLGFAILITRRLPTAILITRRLPTAILIARRLPCMLSSHFFATAFLTRGGYDQ